MPPVIASTSTMPVESISGLGRTSKRDAGRTSNTRPESAICFKTPAFFSSRIRSGEGGNPAASTLLKSSAGLVEAFKKTESPAFNGSEDMRTSGRKIRAGTARPRNQSSFAFYSPKEFCYHSCSLSSREFKIALNPDWAFQFRGMKLQGLLD